MTMSSSFDVKDGGITWVKIQDLDPKEAHRSESTIPANRNEVQQNMKEDYNSRANPSPQWYRRGEPPKKFKPASETVLYFEGAAVTEDNVLQSVGHGIYTSFMNAWSFHEGIVISPDDIWLAVQGSRYCLQIQGILFKSSVDEMKNKTLSL